MEPTTDSTAVAGIPSSREFTILGVTYGFYVAALFMMWPAFIGVMVAYIKRDDVAGTFLQSHYRWLIRTFWWWTFWFALSIAGMAAMVVPTAIEMGFTIKETNVVNVPWELLGAAIGGGFAIMVVWCWVFYRLVRGILRLADGRPTP